ncbi:hypothetical protein IV102_16170 [bacterium]|nr:hypothetical protein [bacterium]
MSTLGLADEIQIRRAPALTQAVSREGVVYGGLAWLCEDLGDLGEGPLVAVEAFCVALGGKVTHPERSLLNLIPPAGHRRARQSEPRRSGQFLPFSDPLQHQSRRQRRQRQLRPLLFGHRRRR